MSFLNVLQLLQAILAIFVLMLVFKKGGVKHHFHVALACLVASILVIPPLGRNFINGATMESDEGYSEYNHEDRREDREDRREDRRGDRRERREDRREYRHDHRHPHEHRHEDDEERRERREERREEDEYRRERREDRRERREDRREHRHDHRHPHDHHDHRHGHFAPKPVATKPVATKLVATKPVATKPAETKPAATEHPSHPVVFKKTQNIPGRDGGGEYKPHFSIPFGNKFSVLPLNQPIVPTPPKSHNEEPVQLIYTGSATAADNIYGF